MIRASLRGCALVVLLALVACTRSELRPDYVRQPSQTIPAKADSPIVAAARKRAAAHGTDSGARLLNESIDALLVRIALADGAKYSIDLQYYLFHSDATGKLLALHVLKAADRGVRVRVLLDDLHQVGKDEVLRALDGHPHVEVRLFNPFYERNGSTWGVVKQFAGDFSRLNRRMHNKAFIVDDAVAVVGGRNIGDEYFDAHADVNFRDMDVMVVGPVLDEIARSFDTYWNSGPAIPIGAFKHKTPDASALPAIRAQLEQNARQIEQSAYGEGVLADAEDLKGAGKLEPWAWGPATFVADDPDKVEPDVDERNMHLAPRVKQWLDTAEHRILLVSPYFVPGDKGVAYLAGKRAEGIDISVLTNSLASTDEDSVYAAYAAYRPQLLLDGVHLYELKPNAEHTRKQRHIESLGASQSSLHSKVIIVDDDKAFVGSMNLDPRSHSLNTEDGLIMTSTVLAGQLAHIFELATQPSVTYEVLLKDGSKTRVYWQTIDDGNPMIYDDAPHTTAWRRFKAGLTRAFPIEGLL
jgi:cardiolipin synthase C